MPEIDLDVVPFLEAERSRPLVGAVAEERPRREHVAAAGLPSSDSLELTQLLERIDADVGVGADADADPARAHALDGKEAVAEVGLRRRTGADPRSRVGEEVELITVRVG